MDRFSLDILASSLARSRRTLLGTALGSAGAATGTAHVAGKKTKRKKQCKATTTKCGKKACCQPGQTCVSGVCETPATATTPAPPFTAITCPGPPNSSRSGNRRFAQTFVANGTGEIGAASVQVNSVPADIAFMVEIRPTQGDAPTAQVLGTALGFNLPVSGSATHIPFAFEPRVPVQQGVTYALVITEVTAVGFVLGVGSAGACAGSAFFASGVGNVFTPIAESLIFTINP